MDQLSLYWKHAAAEAVGDKHGVTEKELKELAPKVRAVHQQQAADRKAGKLKFRDLPYDEEMLDAVHKQVEHFRDRCEVLLVLGPAGGGAIGNVALQHALNPATYNLQSDRTRTGPQLFVLDGADPDRVKAVLDLVTPKIKKTIVNVVSRSGETPATAAQFILFRELLKQKLGKKYKDNILVTTDPAGGTLREVARREGYRTMETPAGVDGLFGILSTVALFSAGICGVDTDALLAGAAAMDKRLKDGDVFANPAALLAALHLVLDRKGKHVSVMVPSANGLAALAEWAGRLWAQTLGKHAAAVPLPLGPLDGSNDKLVTFLEVERFEQKLAIPKDALGADSLSYLADSTFQALVQGEKSAAEYALLEAQRPSLSVVLPRISPETVGQFIYLHQCAVACAAGLLGTDPNGVLGGQSGRERTAALMGKAGSADLAKKIDTVRKRDRKYLV